MTLEKTKQTQLLGRLMMHLLPIQVLLAALGFVNGTVSSLFAGNAIGATALGAVGLYSPISMFITAVSTLLMGGSTVLGGKYMGQDQQERMQGVFSLDLLHPECYFILEHGDEHSFTGHPRFVKERNYGRVHFSFFA